MLSGLIVALLFIIEARKKDTQNTSLNSVIQDIGQQSKNINDQLNGLPQSENLGNQPNIISEVTNSNNYIPTKSGGQLITLNFFDYNKPQFKDILDKIPEIENNFKTNFDLERQYVFSNAGVYRLLSTDYTWIGIDQTEQSESWYAIKDGFLYKTEPNLINPKIILSFSGERMIAKKVKIYSNFRKAYVLLTKQDLFFSGKVRLAILDLDKENVENLTLNDENQLPFLYNDLESLYSQIESSDSVDLSVQSAIQSTVSTIIQPNDRSNLTIEGFEDEPPTFSIDEFFPISANTILLLTRYNTNQLWIANVANQDLEIQRVEEFEKLRTNNVFLNCDNNNICYKYNIENNELYSIEIRNSQIAFTKKSPLLTEPLTFSKFNAILSNLRYQKDLFLVNLNQNLYIESKDGLIQLI